MVDIGSFNQLKIINLSDDGAYLDGNGRGKIPILLRDLPDGVVVGSYVTAFLYIGSDNKISATTVNPNVTVGKCALLSVRGINSAGAFLDWGLSKELFLPFGEQKTPLKVGDSCFVYVFYDKNTDRIVASSKLNRHLSEQNSSFKINQSVTLQIAARTELGYKAVIDYQSLGLIFEADAYRNLDVGELLDGSIKRIRDDGKIDLLISRSSAGFDEDLGNQILAYLRKHGGISALDDKASPESIYKEFKVSKKKYKHALGGLYKRRQVALGANGVQLVH
jgi:predicted RNA-binding protein (virulence factor B family)